MTIYIGVFAISTLLFKLADSVKKEQRIYIDAVALILLCLLAGFRAESIGTDTRGYVQPMIKSAIASDSIKDFLRHTWIIDYSKKSVSNYEIGFSLVTFLVSTIFKSVVITQFVIELLIVLPIYFALRKKGDVPIWFGMFVFMMLFYNGSMNLVRQSIAMAFMLLAVACWMKDDKKKCILSLICAVLFHTSAILGIIIILFYEFVGRERNVGIKTSSRMVNINYINMSIVIGVGILILIATQLVINIMGQFGLSKYIGYILGDIEFMLNQVINVLPPSVMLLLSFKYFKNHQKEWAFYTVMMAYVIIVGQFTSVNPFSGRIRFYFMIFAIFAYPLICKYSKYKRTSKIIMISYLIFYWWFYYVLMESSQTVPYSMIQ